MSVIQQMSDKAFEDKILKELLYKLEENYSKTFYTSNNLSLTEKDINYLLRFSDILCRSKKSQHRNLSLKIISLLLDIDEIRNTEYFRIIATNVLVKLGNFPSLSIINDNNKYLKIDEIRNDYIIKTLNQSSPLGQVFTDGQYSVFEEIKQRNHYSFSGSTSFGKSFVFEAFTKYIIEKHNKTDNIAFIVPTKALINQVAIRLKEIVDEFDYKVITTPLIPKVFLNQENGYVFIFTPERLISYFMEKNNPKIDYLFVDEAHKLLSKKDIRTPLLYHVLVLAKRKSVNIYFASPNIPNADIFLKMINNSTEESMSVIESPVTQNRFFIDTKKDESFMISDFGDKIYFPKLKFGNNNIENLKIILDVFSKNKQSIIYCNTIDKTINTAVKFADIIVEKNDSKEINDVIKMIDEKIHNKYYLKKCLTKGIAYHFGRMPEEIKFKIENLYKRGLIKFLFCTSTLLEGVNLPAKNIFILSENIGNSKMNDIDFWNLAGRAGRLKKDVSGNIFCVNLYNQKGYWKNSKNLNILLNKTINNVEPQILSKKNDNLYKNIINYFDEKEYTNKSLSCEKKKIIEMYGNILLYHDSINNDSVLKNKFIDSSKDSFTLLKKMRESLKISPEILATSIGINVIVQNNILDNEMPLFPEKTEYEDCLNVLDILYTKYNWNNMESGGKNPMIRNRNQLKYYALLMKLWIDSKSLKYIIEIMIKIYYNNGEMRDFYIRDENGRIKPVKFDKYNDLLINSLINNVVYDIENILRFKIKSYVSNYQALLKSKGNLDLCVDWESYIEYGTVDNIIIEIQNLGFSRNLAIFLKNNYMEAFIKDETGMIYDINEKILFENIDKEKYKFEYEELEMFMNWKNN